MYLACLILMASVLPFDSSYALKDEPIVYEGQSIYVMVPERPLGSGSLLLKPKLYFHEFSLWQEEQKLETYQLIQQMISLWKKRGIEDYFIFGKQTPEHAFKWEIIPVPKEGYRFWKKFSLFWHIAFGGSSLSIDERQKIARNLEHEFYYSLEVRSPNSLEVTGNDPFCKQDVINRQLVFEGKEVNLLYNYAPIPLGEEKLHFLIVTKHHREGFADITEEEYLESMQIAQTLVEYYKDKGFPIVYLYDKTGVEAGQTVPHWHEHVVFAASEKEEWLAMLKVLKNMIFNSAPLPEKELKEKVSSLKKELAPVF